MLIYSYIIFGIPILVGFYYISIFSFILFLLRHVVFVCVCEGNFFLKKLTHINTHTTCNNRNNVGLAQAFMVATLILGLRLRVAEAGHLEVFHQNFSGRKAIPLQFRYIHAKIPYDDNYSFLSSELVNFI